MSWPQEHQGHNGPQKFEKSLVFASFVVAMDKS
jgi:hypothetical protein